jgi:EAL domain-containing protein (putative c-di-GMP-specific phosphodiesterase class I)/GGDEF domain-containing protein
VTAADVTDAVTGLPNGTVLLDRLAHAIDRAHRDPTCRFALMVVDFGGPPPGAAAPSRLLSDGSLLTAAARRLETSVRICDVAPRSSQNDLIARLTSEQFVVLLEGLRDVAHAKQIGERLLAEVLAPFTLKDTQVFVLASVGIAVSATGYRHAEDMIRDGQAAAHRARMLGGSHCELFDTAILKSEQTEVRLEGDFADALERGEFRLLYQPIVSLASNQIVGFEALVRWLHPTLGMLSPLTFIPLAEKTGFIVPLGYWILHEACSQLKAWQECLSLPAGFYMSVNLSASQLRHPELVDRIRETLDDVGLEPRSLTLELTESIAMDNPTAVTTLLMELRRMGVRISIDDFGTGYSSLSHLRHFPVDTLKVDRSFVRGMETDADIATIVRTLTGMAQQLGLQVVVEGVENDEQLTLLRSLQCESVQGYLFAYPLDAQTATDVLRTGLLVRPGPTDAPAATTARSKRLFAQIGELTRVFADPKWLAGAAAIAVVITAGVAARFAGEGEPVRPATAGLPGKGVSVVPAESRPAGAHVNPPSTRLEKSAPLLDKPANPDPSAQNAASIRVKHLHSFGDCTGRLAVSRQGIAFTPDTKTKDAFTLKYGEFVQTMEGEALTIKSRDKTYRFKTAGAADKNSTAQLTSFAARIMSFR